MTDIVVRDADPSKALISEVAMEIGKELVAYIEVMYPDVFAKMNSGAKISFRNHVHNDIMSVLVCRTEADYRAWIERRKTHRRKWLKLVRAKSRCRIPRLHQSHQY